MAKDEQKPEARKFVVPAHQGEFRHHAEGAEAPCVTSLGVPRCGCGMYDLVWAAPGKPPASA